jgi:aspartyl-tRNA(Asn)/glutamyl-tRNA(Gln) amidotransferase subunit A
MINPSQATKAALERIDLTEERVRAWVTIDHLGALAQAEAVERRQAAGEVVPLAGLTIGIKDIIDVAGLPTIAGFEPYRGNIAAADALVVRRLKQAGAVVIGKTVTTQFAVGDTAPTGNPWNLERTPGGSSSGSAAAVSAGHVDLALGSQTGGSTLRPASFCGVVGFKPSFGWVSHHGVVPLAPSLDHVGLFGRSVESVAALFGAAADEQVHPAVPSPAVQPPRIGLWRDPLSIATEEVQAAVLAALGQAAAAGADVSEVESRFSYADLRSIHAVVMSSEVGAVHRHLLERHRDAYQEGIRAFVETGQAVPAADYLAALRLRDEARQVMAHDWPTFDLIAWPTVATTAPTPEGNGSPVLQVAMSLLGWPALTLPIGLDHEGLPIGIQLARPGWGDDWRLLEHCRWVEAQLPTMPAPPL